MPSIDLGQVIGPTGDRGPEGPRGLPGNPGPNQITSATATTFNGVLAGSNGVVGVRAVDSTPDSLHTTNLITSAAVADAITGVESDLASIHATGSTNTTGATITKWTYFYLDGVLVQAKADIASGATYTSGTNYETVTAGGLNDLMSALDTKLTYSNSECSGNSSKSITIPNNFRGMLITTGVNYQLMGMWLLRCSGGGAIDYTPILAAYALTLSETTNTLTVTNANSNMALLSLVTF